MAGSRISIDELQGSADFLRLNAAALGRAPVQAVKPQPVTGEADTHAGRAGSKTEILFRDTYLVNGLARFWIPAKGREAHVVAQPTRFFRLRGGGTYTPDFIVFIAGHPISVIEVKGGYRGAGWEQGMERYKRAALEYDGDVFKFTLCEYIRSERRWNIAHWWKTGERID